MATKTTNLELDTGFVGGGEQLRQALAKNFSKIDAAVGEVLSGSKTHDFASVAAAAEVTTTVTVTGAALGDFVVGVSVGVSAAGATLSGFVSAANTVTVVLRNGTAGAIDLASTTLRAVVRKA